MPTTIAALSVGESGAPGMPRATPRGTPANERRAFSTPLVMNNVVYFGSTDGNLYAIE